MIPAHFPQANILFTKPGSMTDEECGSLPVHATQDGRCVSCWEMTDDELADIMKTKRIYLHIWGGQPPAFIGTQPP